MVLTIQTSHWQRKGCSDTPENSLILYTTSNQEIRIDCDEFEGIRLEVHERSENAGLLGIPTTDMYNYKRVIFI